MTTEKPKLVILDRDGVINYDSDDYIKSPDEWQPIPGSLDAIAKLNQQNIKVAVVSNQSGIARGLFNEQTLQQMHNKLQQQLAAIGGHIDLLLYCPHHPDANCACRKPKPEMLLQVLTKLQIKAENTVMIGDSWKDILAANSAQIKAILVQTGKGERTIKAHKTELTNTPIYSDLAHAITALLN